MALEVAPSGSCRRPVPVYDFERIPVFDADPYPYGVEPTGPPVVAPAGGVA